MLYVKKATPLVLRLLILLYFSLWYPKLIFSNNEYAQVFAERYGKLCSKIVRMDISVTAFCGDFLLYASHDYWIYFYEHAIKKIQIITRWKTANNGINKYK